MCSKGAIQGLNAKPLDTRCHSATSVRSKREVRHKAILPKSVSPTHPFRSIFKIGDLRWMLFASRGTLSGQTELSANMGVERKQRGTAPNWICLRSDLVRNPCLVSVLVCVLKQAQHSALGILHAVQCHGTSAIHLGSESQLATPCVQELGKGHGHGPNIFCLAELTLAS